MLDYSSSEEPALILRFQRELLHLSFRSAAKNPLHSSRLRSFAPWRETLLSPPRALRLCDNLISKSPHFQISKLSLILARQFNPNQMSILPRLATSLKRRDEVPNQELAKQVAAKKDLSAVKELVDNLSNKSKDIQHDCIKVLYEIGEIAPSLIVPHAASFLTLLTSKNNRLQWGAMTALNTIAQEAPKLIYSALPKIIAAADAGSVITKDYAVHILINLCFVKQYASDAFSLLIEQLTTSPTNQLPMYAERALPIINDKNKALFIKTLTSRLDDIEKDTKRKRVEKIIKKLTGN